MLRDYQDNAVLSQQSIAREVIFYRCLLFRNGTLSLWLCSEGCLGKKGEGLRSAESCARRVVCLQKGGFSSRGHDSA